MKTTHEQGCLFDYELVVELRSWLRFYPNRLLSLNGFCQLLSSPYVVCASDMLYPSDLVKAGTRYVEFESRGIIRPIPYGASTWEAFRYSEYEMPPKADSTWDNFHALAYCVEHEVPIRLAPTQSLALKDALDHLHAYMKKNGVIDPCEGLSQYLRIIVHTDVPERASAIRSSQKRIVEEDLREVYDSWQGRAKFTFDEFVQVNMPVRDDYVLVSPDEFLELVDDPGAEMLRKSLARLRTIEPTADGIAAYRNAHHNRLQVQSELVGKVAGWTFFLTDLLYKVFAPPGAPDMNRTQCEHGVNRLVLERGEWLFTLTEFTDRLNHIHAHQSPPPYSSPTAGSESGED